MATITDTTARKIVEYVPATSDHSQYNAYSPRKDGGKVLIGKVLSRMIGGEINHIATDVKGKILHPPTSDFNSIDRMFERYVRQLWLEELDHYNTKELTNHYSPSNNPITMQTTNKPTAPKKFNQLEYREFEKARKDGLFTEVYDSYKNKIAVIHKVYNQELNKFDYTLYDHAGKELSKSDKIWELKNQLVANREQLLSDAHQRRIESKANEKETPEQGANEKSESRKAETEKLRQGRNAAIQKENNPEKGNAKQSVGSVEPDDLEENLQIQREQDLEELRNREAMERDANDMER